MAPPAPDVTDRSRAAGLVMGIGAYLSWGIVVLYFKAVEHIPALELVAHRVLWSIPFIFGLMLATGGLPRLRGMLADRRALWLLPISTLLLGANWVLFVWVVVIGQVLQASLAYFITPLMMVVLGVLILGERLNRLQTTGLALATAGVLLLIFAGGLMPWYALAIATTWSLYSFVRKIQHIPAIEGLGVEALFLLPIALGWLFWVGFVPDESRFHPGVEWLLLMASGIVTAGPLMLFGGALRRVKLSTLGFLQYIAPTLQFLLAVLVFSEPFNLWSGVAFGLIWTALVFYTVDGLKRPRQLEVEPTAEAFEVLNVPPVPAAAEQEPGRA